MDADTFAKELTAAAPTLHDLKKAGRKGKMATQVIARYQCVERPAPLTEPAGNDAVLELLRGWDVRSVQVGMVGFPASAADSTGAVCIGCVEADPLVLLPTGEVVVHEMGTNGHVLWRVAKNGAAFLDALVTAARFLAQRTIEAIDFDDIEAARSAAVACAAAAGGKNYENFFLMLLGGAG